MAHVLIVDDEAADLHLMEAILKGEGHEVSLATSGEDAMRAYLRYSVEVVVTDIQMPYGDGIELISALKGLDPDVAIVAVSGQKPHRLQIAQLAGARAILTKPVTREDLVAAVEKASGPPDTDPVAM